MGELRMSNKERVALDAMARVKRKELTVVEAAELMGRSVRQARRVWKRFRAEGDKGLVHKLRGRASNRRLSQDVRERAVKLHQEKYHDFGATLACEKLAEDGLVLSPNTLTALLKERGLWQRRRRRGRHRRRRERRSCLGSLVQMDGSHHDWFEGRAARCVLMVMVDDATGRTYARFYGAETTEAAFDVFGRWAKAYGLPRSLYVDKHSIYRDEDHPDRPTQFGRAMKELGLELILAHSPQAKGRVERRNAVFQDRLVKEMRLRNIRSMEQANAFLEAKFLEELNRRYAVKPRKGQDLHRPVSAGVELDEVLCVHEERVVGNDWCVRWKNRWLQVDAGHAALNLPGRKVLVKELADGRLLVEREGERLSFQELAAKPQPAKAKKPVVNNVPWKPGPRHPWKTGPAAGAAPPGKPAPATPARVFPAGKRRKAG
jgi:transposase